jgi:hypothetical protein
VRNGTGERDASSERRRRRRTSRQRRASGAAVDHQAHLGVELARARIELNEPTKIERWSTAKVLACSPALDVLADLAGARLDRRRAGLIS